MKPFFDFLKMLFDYPIKNKIWHTGEYKTICDKCNKPVQEGNSCFLLYEYISGNGIRQPNHFRLKDRHIAPVGKCEGNKYVYQYLGGAKQPNYNEIQKQLIQDAYECVVFGLE